MMQQMGAGISAADLIRYRQSSNWKDGKFQNLETTIMELKAQKIPGLIYQQFFTNGGRRPSQVWELPQFDYNQFLNPEGGVGFVWFGHSALLLNIRGYIIFIDPMMGGNAAPISPFPVPRFTGSLLSIIDQLPPIDLILISHDHYDHLDFHSIQKLRSKSNSYVTALGVGRHLKKWGIAAEHIHEMDWWDDKEVGNIKITYTPGRHFSGRGLTDRAKSLWGGWVIQTNKEKIWFSGDSGYGSHFAEIGKQLGPFDLGFIECGQYNPMWHQIHMYPEESVAAALEAGVQKAMPVHWGSFALALHHWKEPVDRFVEEAQKRRLDFVVPRQGEVIKQDSFLHEDWWNHF